MFFKNLFDLLVWIRSLYSRVTFWRVIFAYVVTDYKRRLFNANEKKIETGLRVDAKKNTNCKRIYKQFNMYVYIYFFIWHRLQNRMTKATKRIEYSLLLIYAMELIYCRCFFTLFFSQGSMLNLCKKISIKRMIFWIKMK